MKQTITEFEFCNQFKKIRPDNFSYEGLTALFAYFEQLEIETRSEMDFDPIAICSEWAEYKDLDELNEEYDYEYDFESLCGDTQVITVGKEGLIVQQF